MSQINLTRFGEWTALATLAMEYVEPTAELAMQLCRIPAPSFHEQARGEFICQLFEKRGYKAERDEVGNVYALRKGITSHKNSLLLLAHMDTVFPIETPINVMREGNILRGPSIGDNSLSIASMFAVLDMLDALKIQTLHDIVFCSNVGEEGLGNLRGAWAAVRKYQPELAGVIAIDGDFGRVIHRAVGSKRFEIVVSGPGGHSFGSFGNPSAIHGLARGIAAVAEVKVPSEPKTTYNVGIISGGNSINSIAEHATALVDVRSEDPIVLDKVAVEITGLFSTRAGEGLSVTVHLVGNRPAGACDMSQPLVQTSASAIRWMGETPKFKSSSTDANVPISLGIPAVCIGVAKGTGAHTVNEFTDITLLHKGLAHLARVIIEMQTEDAKMNA
jgi:acetylornithine deacetylase/succinyl-diaminopimelate desuccinylase-like protein